MNIVFAGTPEFACPTLAALRAADYPILAALTQPDRPAGRGRKLTASAVKTQAQALGIPVFTPENGAGALAVARALKPDVVVVVAYGLLLPEGLLALPTHGCLNVHASLLPRWRGAAPIARAILAGDAMSGVTIMQMDAGLDTGPTLKHVATPIGEDETTPQLAKRLADMGAQALIDVLVSWRAGQKIIATPQPETGTTYARKLRKDEAHIDWTCDAATLARQIRAFTPWPGTTTTIHGSMVKICAAYAVAEDRHDPGRILATHPELKIGTGKGVLVVTALQAANGRAQTAMSFQQGHALRVGDTLG
ncbi:MAG: methionyl-tRNA formyltransferase [Acidiferrobacter sp.]